MLWNIYAWILLSRALILLSASDDHLVIQDCVKCINNLFNYEQKPRATTLLYLQGLSERSRKTKEGTEGGKEEGKERERRKERKKEEGREGQEREKEKKRKKRPEQHI